MTEPALGVQGIQTLRASLLSFYFLRRPLHAESGLSLHDKTHAGIVTGWIAMDDLLFAALHQFVRPLRIRKEDPCQTQEVGLAGYQDFLGGLSGGYSPRGYNRDGHIFPDGVRQVGHVPLRLRSLDDLRKDKGLIGATHYGNKGDTGVGQGPGKQGRFGKFEAVGKPFLRQETVAYGKIPTAALTSRRTSRGNLIRFSRAPPYPSSLLLVRGETNSDRRYPVPP